MDNVEILTGDQTKVETFKLRENMLWDTTVLDKMCSALLCANSVRVFLVNNWAYGIAESHWLAANAGSGFSALLTLLVERNPKLSNLL